MSESSKSNVFNKLVNNLSNTEKSNLLSKLLKYTDDREDDSEMEAVQSNASRVQAESIEYAKKEFQKYSLLHKIIIYIMSFFKGHTVEDVIIDNELDQLKKEIGGTSGKYINLEEKKFKSAILDKIMPILMEVEHLKHNFKKIFDEKMIFFQFIEYLVETDKKEELTELMPLISPVNIDNRPEFLEKNNYNAERERRVKLYFNKVAKFNFNDFNHEISKLNIVLRYFSYDFEYLPHLFGITDMDDIFSALPEIFITDDILNYLERLDSLMISCDKTILETRVYFYFVEFITYYYNECLGEECDIKLLKESLPKLIGNIDDLKRTIPIEKIIKAMRRNLFYYTRPIENRMNVVDIYKTYKIPIIDKLWENSYNEIKEKSIRNLIADLYDNYTFNSLEFLNQDLKDKLEKYSGIKLKDYYTLNILLKFLSTTYHERIYPILTKIILEGVFSKDIVKANFSSSYYSLKNGSEKINFFDSQLKPGASLQKKVNSALIKASAESNFKSILINVMIDLNEEMGKIKGEIIEGLKMLDTIMASIVNPSNTGGMQKVLANFDDLKMPIYQNPFLACDMIHKDLERFLSVFKLIEETF